MPDRRHHGHGIFATADSKESGGMPMVRCVTQCSGPGLCTAAFNRHSINWHCLRLSRSHGRACQAVTGWARLRSGRLDPTQNASSPRSLLTVAHLFDCDFTTCCRVHQIYLIADTRESRRENFPASLAAAFACAVAIPYDTYLREEIRTGTEKAQASILSHKAVM